MQVFLAVIAIVLSLMLVVGLHEAGHALAAYLFKVKIKRISIGFGKPILLYRSRSGIEWAWSWLLIGGYVQMLNSRTDAVSLNMLPYCFDKQAVWKRIIILLSGALANLIVAMLALQVYFMMGYQQITPIIQTITPQSIAAKANINAGDQIISINEQPTPSWRQAGMQLISLLGKENVPITVETTQGKQLKTSINLNQWTYSSGDNALLTGLGIKPDASTTHLQKVAGQSFCQALSKAWAEMAGLLLFFLVIIKQLVLGHIPFAVLLGPVGLFSEMVISFFHGVVIFLFFIANLSLAVGLVNLFPIPGLDGSLIVYALIEKVRGKPISVAWEILLQRLAIIIFAVALVQLIMNDLQRYFT